MALQYVLGLRKSLVEDDAERRATMAPIRAQRRRVATAFRNQISRETRARPQENPFLLATKNLSPREAKEQIPLTARYIDALLVSGRVVNPKGELTRDGRARIANGVRLLHALRARAGGR